LRDRLASSRSRSSKRSPCHGATDQQHRSSASPGNTGDGIELAQSIGAAVETGYPNAAAWAPTSLVLRKDGTNAPFPHFADRGKPGIIAVLRDGQRFVNEANSYHDFVQGMVRARPWGEPIEAFLIADHRTIRRYGLGHVKPAPLSLRGALDTGYLVRGETIADLAREAGIDFAGLDATIAKWNADVVLGEDRAFGKGSTAYNRFLGDTDVTPNPCLAPIEHGPFYAVRVIPGDIGTFAGLKTDRCARVLDQDKQPIAGLYAIGNDMASVLGGNYSGAGITLGPAMTFGFVAGCHVAGLGGL
jgi:succinate dehydrogenase/fumarate reductase flavoprotein subunit